jgi:copper(I)-binding protein
MLSGAGIALVSGLSPSAGQAQQPQVTVTNAWARATQPHITTSAVYMTLTSVTSDRLVGTSTSAAQQAELHRSTEEGGVVRMRPVVDGLELPAGKAVSLTPGGYHVMLTGLKAPLQPGQTVPLHLTFTHSPPVDVEVTVRSPLSGSGSMPGMKMN